MSSRTRRLALPLFLAFVAAASGCALSDRAALAGLTDRGLLVVHPPRRASEDLRAPTHDAFEVRDSMGQVVRWASGALGGRVSVLLSPGIYEVRSPRAQAAFGTFVHVHVGEVTRVDLTAAGGDRQAGASARSPAERAGR